MVCSEVFSSSNRGQNVEQQNILSDLAPALRNSENHGIL